MELEVVPPASEPEPASFANAAPESSETTKMEHISIEDASLEDDWVVFLVAFMDVREGWMT